MNGKTFKPTEIAESNINGEEVYSFNENRKRYRVDEDG
jgi:hypothetical protein